MKNIKAETKEVAVALKAGDAAKASTELVSAAQKLDKAAARGVIHKNKASRLKSRMAKKVNAVKKVAAAKA
jgi:small subunit ribosomal protein S20